MQYNEKQAVHETLFMHRLSNFDSALFPSFSGRYSAEIM